MSDDEKIAAMAEHLKTVSYTVLSEGWQSWETAPEGDVRDRVLAIVNAERDARAVVRDPH